MAAERIAKFAASLAGIAIALVVGATGGLIVGATISQPMLTAKPTREVLLQADRLDEVLLGDLHDPESINGDLDKLKIKALALPKNQGADMATDIDVISSKLTKENESFRESLWKAHEIVSGVRARVKGQAEATEGLPIVVYDQARRFLKWTGPAIAIALVLLGLAAANPRIREWLGRARTVGFGPLSVAIGDVTALKQGIRQRFKEVDDAIVATYQDKIEKFGLEGLFIQLKADIDQRIRAAFGVDMADVKHRATMFVPGFTDEQLVQVTNYAPPQHRERLVVGRRFSVRYGIIGRSFRLRTALYNWEVNNAQNSLVRYWGLTRREAHTQGAHPMSLMALPIPNPQGDPLAIIYIEAEGKNQLMPGLDTDLLKRSVPNDPDDRVVADRLADEGVWDPLWKAKAVQPLFEALLAMRAEFNWDAPLQGKEGQ